jgi:hypothetical protein
MIYKQKERVPRVGCGFGKKETNAQALTMKKRFGPSLKTHGSLSAP